MTVTGSLLHVRTQLVHMFAYVTTASLEMAAHVHVSQFQIQLVSLLVVPP